MPDVVDMGPSIGIDPNERIDLGIPADPANPEVIFGQSILQFGTGATEEYAAGQTFQKALSDPLATIYDILKEKGILKPGVSNEYLLNLDKNVNGSNSTI